MDTKIADYAYLWNGSQQGWGLLRLTDSSLGFGIYNAQSQVMLHIDDEILHARLVELLKEKHLPIYDNVIVGDVEVTPIEPE